MAASSVYPLLFLVLVGIVTANRSPTIVSSIKALGIGEACKDSDGNVQSHGQTWAPSSEQCSEYECHHGLNRKFVVMKKCKQFHPAEIPDPVHCREVTDSSKAFPDCCPVLQCDGRTAISSSTPATCDDRHTSPTACKIWKDELDGCTAGSIAHQFTTVYCRQSCGFC